MTEKPVRALKAAAVATLLAAGMTVAQAQQRDQARPSEPPAGRLESLQQDTSSFFGQLFGGGERFSRDEAPVRQVQMSPSELVVRLDRMENQIRQLTGLVEQLQFRNQQLEQQVRRLQEPGGGAIPQAARPPSVQPPPPPAVSGPPGPPGPPGPGLPQRRSDVVDPNDSPGAPGAPRALPRRPDGFEPSESAPGALRPGPRRSDVFDPNENPNAPGAPRVLGSLPSGPGIVTGDPNDDDGPPIGAPGGRQAGAPLDLSTLSDRAANDPGLPPPQGPASAMSNALPPPPPRSPSATGTYQLQATLPPTATPKDEYDLAYGYLVRKDYALAEESFRTFLRKYPSDRAVAEANYWLGESMFQRQRYRDAAESFLTVSTKFEKSGKAPDALLRLGQSLAALKEKEAACATFVEVGRKYPRASPTVRQGVEREQKRAGC
jgi:tol-pal system protein YbgF